MTIEQTKERYAQIVKWRSGDNPKTLQWIGDQYGITRERIRQIYPEGKCVVPQTKELICLGCDKSFTVSIGENKLTCSAECLSEYFKRRRLQLSRRATKFCPLCKKDVLYSNYTKRKDEPLLAIAYCRPCMGVKVREWRDENPERYKEVSIKASKKWQANNKEQFRESCKRRYYRLKKEHPEKIKAYWKKSYAKKKAKRELARKSLLMKIFE